MVFRQGFKTVQIQGVEFAKLGQPGKMGHYPIHFHMAREVPPNTFIKDSTINESMTRWIVLHSTQGVLLQRNIGYKSIGHGFYLESGTETDNKFYSNLGIFARAAVDNPQNPRKLPGILAYTGEFFKPFQERVRPSSRRFPPMHSRGERTTSIPRCSGSPTAGTTSSAIWRPARGPAGPPIGSSRPGIATCPT